MNKIINKKYANLSVKEMTEILGGRWVESGEPVVCYECTKTDIKGDCIEARVFTLQIMIEVNLFGRPTGNKREDRDCAG